MKNDGGAAFARPIGHVPAMGATYNEAQKGMSLRDWFAGQAVPSILAIYGTADADTQHIAFLAYRIADAMIEERGK